ncbi:uncharacterized protein LOC105700836 isoform X2 [Orussus abietinus]|uniref:uncharacterized protein LOC105700836 isoform X2 n=1 Tax=Orussus abietinus TaxID=222816 RepID=UPI000626C1A7|nr:uncharacterized protein LOC105700836 isoform X2 [Orussus abietinus]
MQFLCDKVLYHKQNFASYHHEIQELVINGQAVREKSYSPYSKFKVGAALLCVDGTISAGCNMENASYPAGICAERSAICKAVSEGKRKFKALTVVADLDDASFTLPCGICRQTIAEFGDIPVFSARSDMKKVLRTSLQDLLPLAFNPVNSWK